MSVILSFFFVTSSLYRYKVSEFIGTGEGCLKVIFSTNNGLEKTSVKIHKSVVNKERGRRY